MAIVAPETLRRRLFVAERRSFFERLKQGLLKSRTGMVDRIAAVLTSHRALDESLFEEIEEILIQADVGVATAMQLVEHLREEARAQHLRDADAVMSLLKESMRSMLANAYSVTDQNEPLDLSGDPSVILVVGVNGVGKTTTIGKLAGRLQEAGRRPLLAAADTFRAAAGEQLEAWGERVGCPVVRHAAGADPAAVAFDAIQAARARGNDVVLVDTAGRLHNKANLMAELAKIRRVIERAVPGAPHEVLLVIDGTTGQNAVQQAKTFNEVTPVSGLIVTKLDGTARGGVILAIHQEVRAPIKYIGVGEQLGDLQPFDAASFIEALFTPLEQPVGGDGA